MHLTFPSDESRLTSDERQTAGPHPQSRPTTLANPPLLSRAGCTFTGARGTRRAANLVHAAAPAASRGIEGISVHGSEGRARGRRSSSRGVVVGRRANSPSHARVGRLRRADG